ncbi:unnamed protein product [Meloidogyne enterolobii]|uniref:Uncharacterized protein n=1 Tax=Meloidogyne enterolobii TaxID=390850 RepID=A0ACB0ZWG7_MELEN
MLELLMHQLHEALLTDFSFWGDTSENTIEILPLLKPNKKFRGNLDILLGSYPPIRVNK